MSNNTAFDLVEIEDGFEIVTEINRDFNLQIKNKDNAEVLIDALNRSFVMGLGYAKALLEVHIAEVIGNIWEKDEEKVKEKVKEEVKEEVKEKVEEEENMVLPFPVSDIAPIDTFITPANQVPQEVPDNMDETENDEPPIAA